MANWWDTADRDDEGFPVLKPEHVGRMYIDEFDVAWVCVIHEELDTLAWVPLKGWQPPGDLPPL